MLLRFAAATKPANYADFRELSGRFFIAITESLVIINMMLGRVLAAVIALAA